MGYVFEMKVIENQLLGFERGAYTPMVVASLLPARRNDKSALPARTEG